MSEAISTLKRGYFLWSSIEHRVAVAAITVAELWFGLERASTRYRKPRLRYLQEFISSVSVIPYGQAAAYEHARIWAKLQASGQMIGHYDLIVAATAFERNSAIATFTNNTFLVSPA